MLAAFILGLALGGLWVRHRIDRLARPACASSAWCRSRWAWPRRRRSRSTAARSTSWPGCSTRSRATPAASCSSTSRSTVIALLVMLPATFCAGMTLPLITYRLLRSPTGEKALGAVYAVNTLGAIARRDRGGAPAARMAGPQGHAASWARRSTWRWACVLVLALGRSAGALHARAGARPRSRSPRSWPSRSRSISTRARPPRASSAAARRASRPTTQILYHRDGKTATVDVVDDKGCARDPHQRQGRREHST